MDRAPGGLSRKSRKHDFRISEREKELGEEQSDFGLFVDGFLQGSSDSINRPSSDL